MADFPQRSPMGKPRPGWHDLQGPKPGNTLVTAPRLFSASCASPPLSGASVLLPLKWIVTNHQQDETCVGAPNSADGRGSAGRLLPYSFTCPSCQKWGPCLFWGSHLDLALNWLQRDEVSLSLVSLSTALSLEIALGQDLAGLAEAGRGPPGV